jgi:hypothetical protein
MALQIRRGTEQERQLIIPSAGEPIYTTDSKKLYIGDGVSVGGISVSSPDIINPISGINDLNDVAITNPLSNQVLKWSGTSWINSFEESSPVLSVNGLTGVIELTTDTIPEGALKFFSNDRAKDAAADLLVNGTHSSLTFNYNPITRTIESSLSSNITTNVIGNLTGLVLGTDQSIIINSQEKTITGKINAEDIDLTGRVLIRSAQDSQTKGDLGFDSNTNAIYLNGNGVDIEVGSTQNTMLYATTGSILLFTRYDENSEVNLPALSVDQSTILNLADNTVVAGNNSGQVDSSTPVKFLKITVDFVEYALPLYAIRP